MGVLCLLVDKQIEHQCNGIQTTHHACLCPCALLSNQRCYVCKHRQTGMRFEQKLHQAVSDHVPEVFIIDAVLAWQLHHLLTGTHHSSLYLPIAGKLSSVVQGLSVSSEMSLFINNRVRGESVHHGQGAIRESINNRPMSAHGGRNYWRMMRMAAASRKALEGTLCRPEAKWL